MNQAQQEYEKLKLEQDVSSFDLMCSNFKSHFNKRVEDYEEN